MNYWFLIFIITSTYRNNKSIKLWMAPGSKFIEQQGCAVNIRNCWRVYLGDYAAPKLLQKW